VIPKALLFAVVMTSSVVSAGPSPVTVNVGLGVAEQRWDDDINIDPDSKGFMLAATLYAQIGIPVSPDLAIVVHGGISAPKLTYAYAFCPDPFPGMTPDTYPFHYIPLEVGVGVDYTFPSDVWVSPWIGLEKLAIYGLSGDLEAPASLALGLEAGIDLYQDDAGNRTGLFVKTTLIPAIHKTGENESANYLQIAAGVAYRFR
jgi:hypothetical protein